VKAVNSMLQGVLAEDNPVDVFFAGDSAEAKTRVVAFLESSDMRPPTQEGSKWLMSLNGPAYFLLGVAHSGAGFNIALGAKAL